MAYVLGVTPSYDPVKPNHPTCKTTNPPKKPPYTPKRVAGYVLPAMYLNKSRTKSVGGRRADRSSSKKKTKNSLKDGRQEEQRAT